MELPVLRDERKGRGERGTRVQCASARSIGGAGTVGKAEERGEKEKVYTSVSVGMSSQCYCNKTSVFTHQYSYPMTPLTIPAKVLCSRKALQK